MSRRKRSSKSLDGIERQESVDGLSFMIFGLYLIVLRARINGLVPERLSSYKSRRDELSATLKDGGMIRWQGTETQRR